MKMKNLIYPLLLLPQICHPFTTTRSPSFLPTPSITTKSTFVSSSSSVHRRPPPSSTSFSSLTMLIEPSGKDLLEKLTNTPTTTSPPKLFTKTPPKLLKIASLSSIPLSFTLGLLSTPSNRILARAVGGLATATIGTVTKSRLDDYTSAAAKPAIARLILERGNLAETTTTTTDDANNSLAGLAADIAAVQSDYDVEENDFRGYLTDIYGLYLLGMCQNPMAKTSEMKELSALKEALSLSNLELGEAHATAAVELYRQIGLYTPEEELDDEGHPDRMKIDKCLFLSERAFRSAGETDEAFNFEMSRVSKAFKMTTSAARERVAEVAEPFYKRALGSTRSKLGSGKVTKEMLERARESLGIEASLAADLHLGCYNEEIKSLMVEGEEDGAMAFAEGAMERLNTLQEILEISDEDAAYERSVECTPIFQKSMESALVAILNGTDSSAADCWNMIESTRQSLCLTKDSMMPLLDGAVVQQLGKPLEKAQGYINVGNKKALVETLEDGLNTRRAVFALLQEGAIGDLERRYFDPTGASSANGFISPTDRQRMYTTLLSTYLTRGENNLSSDMQSTLSLTASYLGLSDYEISEASRAVCGPLVETALKTAALEITGDDFTETLAENLKVKTDQLIADLGVKEELVKEYGKNLFRDSLKLVFLKCPNGIPSPDQKTQLSTLASLLNLSTTDVAPFYTQTFSKVYKKSVLESMGSTGIILPEYRDALNKLRERLEIPQDDERDLFIGAATERVRPMVQLLANELERTMLTKEQLGQKRGVDMGQDVFKGGASAKGSTLGITTQDSLISDTFVLIDFYKENDLIQKNTDNTTTYPITAISLSAIDPEMAEALYRQFVVSGFATQDAEKQQRIESESPTFGGILGLNIEHQTAIRKSIASLIYENYINNALSSKPALDQNDMMFLANIQMKLELSSEKSEEMMLESQKKVLFDSANALMERGLTAASVKSFRDRCAGMGMDPLADVEIPSDRICNMFKIEVGEGITSGDISLDDTSLLQEIQESLGLAVDVAESALAELVSSVCQNALDKMGRELMRGREENCVEEVRRMVTFLKLTGGEVGGLNLPDEDVCGSILRIYKDSEGSEEVGVELLKGVLLGEE